MGWERKRGKLLDLNKFLLHQHDSFPDKGRPFGGSGAGPLRHHSGLRHAASARHRRTHDRHHGASAESSHHRIRSFASSPRDMASCSPAWASASPLHHGRVSPPSTPAKPASISTRAPSPTSIRISSAKASLPARASMKSASCMRCWIAAFLATLSCLTISSRAPTLAPASSPTSRSSTTTRRTTPPTPAGSTAGSAATGRSRNGSSAACPTSPATSSRTPSAPSRDGRSSTICAAAWLSPSPFSCSSSDGSFFPAERSIGPSPASFFCFFPSLSSWPSISAAPY